MNRLRQLAEQGQSVWFDFIRRSLLTSGDLERLVREDGVAGVTSNPAIFQKAISGSDDYEEALAALPPELDAKAAYERLAVEDVRMACDVLAPLHGDTQGRDGYVSLEVSPRLAHDTLGTVEEARRLWKEVDRPNLMIKVPATPEGLPAIERLIGEGIHVNVTLLFAREMYEKAAEAYLLGLERFAADGGDLARIASVASFFVSRIDSAVDARLAALAETAESDAERARLQALVGKVAIANAKLAYASYKEIFSGERWEALEEGGARPQRVLWASTSTKNPDYRDVIYVEELVGPDTVNTIPPTTLDAFRDHGEARPSLEEGVEEARQVLADLEAAGVSLEAVTGDLLAEGVRKFVTPFETLLAAVETARARGGAGRLRRTLPRAMEKQVAGALAEWDSAGNSRRLWERDASLWTGSDEASWLGWLDIVRSQRGHLPQLVGLADQIRDEGFAHAVVLGMGGSSLCPDVLARTFGRVEGSPELHVLDSTDPAQIRALESRLDLARTLFVVSSKSGTTLEPNTFLAHFLARVRETIGEEAAGRHFLAITDPGSKLEEEARAVGFRDVLHGVPEIGGRFSALSHFGLAPAALMGLDAGRLLDRADEMVAACGPDAAVAENPGVALGIALGVLAQEGYDKVTLVASEEISGLGGWLEQLLAESTGHEGKALIPVDGEAPAPGGTYGYDRVFVHLRLDTADNAGQDRFLADVQAAGHPVIRISLRDPYDLTAEFFRWEVATAAAGALLGVNPFVQPDVEASKVETRKLTSAYVETGSLPAETPFAIGEGGIQLFADERNAAELTEAVGDDPSIGDLLRAHLGRARAGDYFALLAYVEMCEANDRPLQAIRHAVRDARGVATCLGYGPRFLHSTGQAYKGGPDSGVFLQVTCDDANDLPVPGMGFTFGVVKAAQARGDFEVLAERGRRALRVHLGGDVEQGLRALHELVEWALRG